MNAHSEFDTITISQERYEELLRAENILEALRRNGVDNWEYYDDAMDEVGE